MAKSIYKTGDQVAVLCEIRYAGLTDEFHVSLERSSWYVTTDEVLIKELPARNNWAPGEIKAIVKEDFGDTVLIQVPYERILGKNPLEVSKHLIRPFPHEEYVAL